MKNAHFLNGQIVSEDDLQISPRDLGYSRGYAVFEFMLAHKGRPFMLDKHMDRLFASCESIALTLPWSKEQISEWVLKTLDANKSKEEKVIRIIISGGPSETLVPASMPTIVMVVDSRLGGLPEEYEKGVHVLLSEFQRYEPQAKTNNYIEAVRQFRSIPKDIHEVIYHSENMVREGTRCNVFALVNGTLVTPRTGILEGITRSVILNELQLSLPVETRDFSVKELLESPEVFITATSKEVMPVTKLNNQLVGDGLVGPVTKEVMSKFRAFFESDLW